jgi:hypothetical protein
MEGICKDFSDYIMTKIELKKWLKKQKEI